MVDNLGKESIIAKWIIDHIRFAGGLETIAITKELTIAAAGAPQKYLLYLDEQKNNQQ